VSETELPDPIQQLDVAVVDEDLLWRVDVMNGLRPLYADDFASAASVTARVHELDQTVVLLGREVNEHVAEEVSALRTARPNVVVVAVAGPRVPDGGLPGVDLVLPDDIDDRELVDTVRWFVDERRAAGQTLRTRAAVPEVPAEPERETRLVLVTSAKGGVGRSTVAFNLATLLARQDPEASVALVETDAVYGDLPMFVHRRGPGPLRDLWPGTLTDAMVTEHCTFPFGDDGLEVVLPPTPSDPWQPLGPDDAKVLIRGSSVAHDWIVADISPHLLHGSELVALADVVYVVASTDLAGLGNATTLTNALRLRAPRPHAVNLVLVDRTGQGGAAKVVAETACAPVVATIPHDRHVPDAIHQPRPFVDQHPRTRAARALRSLAERTRTALGATAPAGG
jgi:MinD-like ATPase involved in chromosome partitioning or flagellar assembly